ncbi:hypothetical protein [Vitiosangium sp. GDMCC 1.1324]|uniref:hypothetical protein n=1 Tax=Vitiosangium sp. (strain GDMCC 1.1324) TaxID=2138576 RepID=UPI000D36CF04|nr:hypothetical protein [Vitiosangium sp. GDMCC 1.1324]PTL77293.1 hypothetical protein DAT35_45520 [Vitiosangium sp. GDMCC 1.1324]
MRKLMMAVMTVAGIGLMTAGCQQKSEVQKQREDVASAQRDVTKAEQDANRKVAETRQEEQKDVNEAQGNLNKEQSDLAKAEQEQATGGSGTATAQTEEVKGTIQSASASTITIIVPDKNNQMMRFQANPQVVVTRDEKPVALKDLKPGDEVRASYQMDPNGQMVLKSIDVKKASAQHPGVKAK